MSSAGVVVCVSPPLVYHGNYVYQLDAGIEVYAGDWLRCYYDQERWICKTDGLVKPPFKTYVKKNGVLEFVVKYTIGVTRIEPFGIIHDTTSEFAKGTETTAILTYDYHYNKDVPRITQILFQHGEPLVAPVPRHPPNPQYYDQNYGERASDSGRYPTDPRGSSRYDVDPRSPPRQQPLASRYGSVHNYDSSHEYQKPSPPRYCGERPHDYGSFHPNPRHDPYFRSERTYRGEPHRPQPYVAPPPPEYQEYPEEAQYHGNHAEHPTLPNNHSPNSAFEPAIPKRGSSKVEDEWYGPSEPALPIVSSHKYGPSPADLEVENIMVKRGSRGQRGYIEPTLVENNYPVSSNFKAEIKPLSKSKPREAPSVKATRPVETSKKSLVQDKERKREPLPEPKSVPAKTKTTKQNISKVMSSSSSDDSIIKNPKPIKAGQKVGSERVDPERVKRRIGLINARTTERYNNDAKSSSPKTKTPKVQKTSKLDSLDDNEDLSLWLNTKHFTHALKAKKSSETNKATINSKDKFIVVKIIGKVAIVFNVQEQKFGIVFEEDNNNKITAIGQCFKGAVGKISVQESDKDVHLSFYLTNLKEVENISNFYCYKNQIEYDQNWVEIEGAKKIPNLPFYALDVPNIHNVLIPEELVDSWAHGKVKIRAKAVLFAHPKCDYIWCYTDQVEIDHDKILSCYPLENANNLFYHLHKLADDEDFFIKAATSRSTNDRDPLAAKLDVIESVDNLDLGENAPPSFAHYRKQRGEGVPVRAEPFNILKNNFTLNEENSEEDVESSDSQPPYTSEEEKSDDLFSS